MFLYLPCFITGTTSELENNPKYIAFPNSARIEFHYRDLHIPESIVGCTIQTEDNIGFIPLEDVVGEDYYIHGKKEEETKE